MPDDWTIDYSAAQCSNGCEKEMQLVDCCYSFYKEEHSVYLCFECNECGETHEYSVVGICERW